MSFVLAMPKKDLDMLQGNGGIPKVFWDTFPQNGTGYISAWQHYIVYKPEWDQPGWTGSVDLEELFGLEPTTKDEEKRNNERLVTTLLQKPQILVIFLGEQFCSLSEISAWAQHFENALNRQYPAENSIRNSVRSLVLIARENNFRATKDELRKFNECIGGNKVFQSVYYMGPKLQIENGKPYFSKEVWDIMLARLLMAFVLSGKKDEQNSAFYISNGLKLWRCSEITKTINTDFEDEAINEALSQASNELKNRLDKRESLNIGWSSVPTKNDLKKEMDHTFGSDLKCIAKKEKWRCEPSWGWSDFEATECLNKTTDEKKEGWRRVLEKWRQLVPKWRKDTLDALAKEEYTEKRDVYDQVKISPEYLCPEVSELRKRLDTESVKNDPVGNWKNMAEAAQSRAKALEKLSADTPEFERARGRYVGIGLGILVCLAVTLALGWIGYWIFKPLAVLLNKNEAWALTFSLIVTGCVAFGSLAAMAVVTACHYFAGKRGMKELIKDSTDADEKLAEIEIEAQEIIAAGIVSEADRSLHAKRFRAWILLKRLRDILQKEITPQIVKGKPSVTSMSADSTTKNDGKIDPRSEFLKETRKECPLDRMTNQKNIDTFVKNKIDEWWNTKFSVMWRELINIDAKNAGNYPAMKVVPKLRNIVNQLIVDLRNAWCQEMQTHNQKKLENELKGWIKKETSGEGLKKYASAISTGHHGKPTFIYYNLEKFSFNIQYNMTPQGGYEPKTTKVFDNTDHLGFIYQEWCVEFDVSAAGELEFKELPDA